MRAHRLLTLAVALAMAALAVAPTARAASTVITGRVSILNAPMPGVTVKVWLTGTELDSFVTTGADGTYRYDVPNADTYSIRVLPPDPYLPQTIAGIPVGDGQTVVKDFALDGDLTISGSLVLDNGASASGSVVACSIDSGACTDPAYFDGGAYSLTTGVGHFTFRYELTDPLAGGYFSAGVAGHFVPEPGGATPVTVAADLTLPTVTVPAVKHLGGSVYIDEAADIGYLNSEAGGSVLVCQAGTTSCVSSDIRAGGFFDLDIPAGTYTVYLDLDAPAESGWYSQGAPGNFAADSADASRVVVASDVELPLVMAPRPHEIDVSCATADGGDCPGDFDLTTQDGRILTSAVSPYFDASFVHVAPGSYKIHLRPSAFNVGAWYSASAPGYSTRFMDSATTVVVTRQTGTIVLPQMVVQAGGQLEGTLMLADTGVQPGEPGFTSAVAANVSVAAFDAGGSLAATAVTDDTGAFAMPGLAFGAYTIGFNLDGASTRLPGGWLSSADATRFSVDTPAAATVDGILTTDLGTVYAPRLRVVDGRVLDRTQPVAGAVVAICTTEASPACSTATTTASGVYAVAGLATGDYTVRVTPPSSASLSSGYYAAGAPGNISTAIAAATSVHVASDMTLHDITLPRGHRISGAVAGCTGCTVTLAGTAAYDPILLDDGTGAFSVVVASGEYTLTFSKGATTLSYNGTATLGAVATAVDATLADVALGDLAGDFGLPVSDAVPPRVTATTPANGTTRVARNAVITVLFSEAVVGVSATSITLRDLTANRPVAITVRCTGTVATVRPTALLPAGHILRLLVGFGVTDTTGNPVIPHVVAFSATMDATAPRLVSRTPGPGTTWASRTTDITATFTEAVRGVGAGSIRLLDLTTARYVAASVTYRAATHRVVLHPETTLARHHLYKVVVSSAIHDAAGNPVRSGTWIFTTRR